MPTQLLNDQYAPITSEIGFIDCDLNIAVDAFVDWIEPIQSTRGVRLHKEPIAGDLPLMLNSLLPLTSVETRRYLFVPTRSTWTAYFDNGWRGTDVFSTVSTLCEKVGCRGIRAVSIPHTIRKIDGNHSGRYGATIFELYASRNTGCSFLNIQRSISASNDGGKWRFDASGEILAFEQPDLYLARQVRDRFTPELLCQYMLELGIDFSSSSFYENARPAVRITKQGPHAKALIEYSLDDARSQF